MKPEYTVLWLSDMSHDAIYYHTLNQFMPEVRVANSPIALFGVRTLSTKSLSSVSIDRHVRIEIGTDMFASISKDIHPAHIDT